MTAKAEMAQFKDIIDPLQTKGFATIDDIVSGFHEVALDGIRFGYFQYRVRAPSNRGQGSTRTKRGWHCMSGRDCSWRDEPFRRTRSFGVRRRRRRSAR